MGDFFYNLLTGEVLGCILIYFPHLCFAYVSYLKGTAKLSPCFLPAIALSGCSSDFCHDTCCQALSPLEITIKMVHWQAVPFVTVGDSEIFPVIFIIAVGNFLKLCILIKYFFSSP